MAGMDDHPYRAAAIAEVRALRGLERASDEQVASLMVTQWTELRLASQNTAWRLKATARRMKQKLDHSG